MKRFFLGIAILSASLLGQAQVYYGDLNHDNKIDVTDLGNIVDIILGNKTAEQFTYANSHDYVDLGLSVKWATMNVGASNPWDYGTYFAWGETQSKTTYSWATYFDTTDGGTTFTKYTLAGKSALDITNDAAHFNWGGSWRMPTHEEIIELSNNCYWEYTTSYNSKGKKGFIIYKVKSDSDRGVVKTAGSSTTTVGSYSLSDPHIFLPFNGFYTTKHVDDGSAGYYWMSSLKTDATANLLSVFSMGVGYNSSISRFNGANVRAVLP